MCRCGNMLISILLSCQCNVRWPTRPMNTVHDELLERARIDVRNVKQERRGSEVKSYGASRRC